MSIALGDMLRQAREARGLSIDQLATITRLNPHFIEALEEGRWDRLPGQVYLKPFAKTCAEALGLDIKEVYKLIDGEKKEEQGGEAESPAEDEKIPPKKSGFDYRVPLVIIIGLVIIGLIYVVISYQQNMQIGSSDMKVVPAGGTVEKREAVRSRPWEKPALWEHESPGSERLRLEASDTVWVSVISEGDTLFAGFFRPGGGRTFLSRDGFVLNLGRNDCINGYLDGEKIPQIGSSVTGLYNFKVGMEPEGE